MLELTHPNNFHGTRIPTEHQFTKVPNCYAVCYICVAVVCQTPCECCGCAGSTATYTIMCALLWALPLILYVVYRCMFVSWALLLILYAVYCCMFVPWALLLILYAVYYHVFVPWALPLILYAVYCRMFVPWALLLILYAVYCRMFVPWALPLILYAVYCRMFVPWALLLVLYAVHCCMFVPWALLLILYAVYCHMFVPWALHCYSKLLAVAVLPYIIGCTCTATWFPPVGITAVHGILCNVWRITHVLSHDSLL